MPASITLVITIIIFLFFLNGCTDNYSRAINLDNVSDDELIEIINRNHSKIIFLQIIELNKYKKEIVEMAFEKLMSRHDEWDWESIEEKKVKIGMTKQELILAWGEPYQVNRTVEGDQWIYKDLFLKRKYVYIENSRVFACN